MLNLAISTIKELYNSSIDVGTFLARIDVIGKEVVPYLENATGNPAYSRLIWLKISNLLIGKFQFQSRHTALVSRPLGLIVDPSNSCPLSCPGCLRSDKWRRSGEVDWPVGQLSHSLYGQLIRQYAPYALYIHFFNWGEPLLNKYTPSFVALAKTNMLCAVISSNLSVNFDAEALVLSGLDFLIMSIDGATAHTYQKYRRGGNFKLVIDNVKKLVAAKKKFNLQTPRLHWQFLTFQHNIDEIDQAKSLAEELGVNEIRFSTPYDVSWSDPALCVDSTHDHLLTFTEDSGRDLGRQKITESLSALSAEVGGDFWFSQRPTISSETVNGREGKSCQWLYRNMVMDAHGRILPCCYIPKISDQYHYSFSTMSEGDKEDHYNSDSYRSARQAFGTEGLAKDIPLEGKVPFCQVCHDPNQARPYARNELVLRYFDTYYLGSLQIPPFISKANVEWLVDWSC